MKAVLKNHHQAPRKVRLVADAIRGKSVPAARHTLTFLNKKAAEPVAKLLNSAVANAQVAGESAESLVVTSITVDKGMIMKRYRPFARGRAGTIRKTMSHVAIELASVKKTENRKQRTAKKAAKVEK